MFQLMFVNVQIQTYILIYIIHTQIRVSKETYIDELTVHSFRLPDYVRNTYVAGLAGAK